MLRAILSLIGGNLLWYLDAKLLIKFFKYNSERGVYDDGVWWHESLDRGGIVCVLYAIFVVAWGLFSIVLCGYYNVMAIGWISDCVREMFV